MNNLDALDRALKALADERAEKPEPDEFSAEQYAEHAKCGPSKAKAKLLAGFRAGLVTRRRIGCMYYYRLTDSAPR